MSLFVGILFIIAGIFIGYLSDLEFSRMSKNEAINNYADYIDFDD